MNLTVKMLLTITVSLLIAGMVLVTRTETLAMSHSSLMRLATLKAMAGTSVPYEMAMANGKPTLLEFYADWCTTCQRMAPIVKNLEQQYGDAINVVMLDIDQPQWAKLIDRYQVTGVPQFTFLDGHHDVEKRLVGNVPESVMTQWVARLLANGTLSVLP